ncbi:unnamed protein product, partial [Rotaria magnacalcarata]
RALGGVPCFLIALKRVPFVARSGLQNFNLIDMSIL